MLEALMEGQEDPVKLADLAQRQLRGKIPELEKALEGHLTEHHRFLLRLLWKELGQQEELIAERSEEHTSELQSRLHLVCRLLLEKKKKNKTTARPSMATTLMTSARTIIYH